MGIEYLDRAFRAVVIAGALLASLYAVTAPFISGSP
jgi:hypothetical protein